MLVMRRRAGESFLIGDSIEIEILEVGPTRVKLGITAPPNLGIARKEVVLTRAENMTAARGADVHAIAWLTRALEPRFGRSVKSLTASSNTPGPENQ